MIRYIVFAALVLVASIASVDQSIAGRRLCSAPNAGEATEATEAAQESG